MLKINWVTKFMMKFFPNIFMRYAAKEMDIDYQKIEQAMKLFGEAKRIDIHPSSSGSRGFILILDKKLALYFYQDGDTFCYDGHEMGKYEKGKVTVFDKLEKK